MNMAEGLGESLVESALEDWAEWMRQDEPLTAGYPSKAAGMLIPSWMKDAEEAYEEVDAQLVKATDAAIDSLPRLSRLAVMAHFRLAPDVWKFREASRLYAVAKKELEPLLRKRGVI